MTDADAEAKKIEVYTNGSDRGERLLQRILRIPFRNCRVVLREAIMRDPEIRVDGEIVDEDTAAISLAVGSSGARW